MTEDWIAVIEESLGSSEPGLLLWDADYTLWEDDIGLLAWDRALLGGQLRAEAREALSEELIAIGALPRFEPHADGATLMELYRLGAVSADGIVTAMATCFAGWQIDELRGFGAAIAGAVLAGSLYAGLRSAMERLAGRGFEHVVVSASAEPLVEGAVEVLGLPVSRVFGARSRRVDGRVGARLERLCHGENKAEVVRAALPGAAVRGAFGDSPSDGPMLQLADRLRGAVNPKPAFAEQAARLGPPWRLLRPRRREDGGAVSARGLQEDEGGGFEV